jgi:hypothetical protein
MEIRSMKLTRALPIVALLAPLVLPACGDDDGAATRQAGSVVIIGPPPPGGGGSVSAVGTGCVTKGATTKRAATNVQFALDEYSIEAPAQLAAGVSRIVVKNFGSDPHEIVITLGADADDLPVVDGAVDLEALPNKLYRVQEFAGNTICEGTFDLPAGDYVVFSNLVGADGSDFERGMFATFTVG